MNGRYMEPRAGLDPLEKMEVTNHCREWNHCSSAKAVPTKLSQLMILLPSPSSHLRLDLPSGIFPSDFPVKFCIPSHPSYFQIWFQSHVTSSFMNCNIANEMVTFRNLHNSSTRFQHYCRAGLQTHLSKRGAHNICFPVYFRRKRASVRAGLLRIGQVFLSPVKICVTVGYDKLLFHERYDPGLPVIQTRFVHHTFMHGLFNRVQRRRLWLKMQRQMDVKEVHGRLITDTIPTMAWIKWGTTRTPGRIIHAPGNITSEHLQNTNLFGVHTVGFFFFWGGR